MAGSDTRGLWQVRLRRYERSGLTVAEFCGREGISTASFYQWRRRLAETHAAARQQPSAPTPPAAALPAFQQVTLAGGGVVAVEFSRGVRMELPAHALPLVRAVVAELLQAEAGRGAGDA
ncbi:MAG: transposase [Pirellulales bacterium]